MTTQDTPGKRPVRIVATHQQSRYVRALRNAGEVDGSVNVQIGPRFLELFSENLYSSPNKAFEELVSNSWDAGASVVHVGIPASLQGPGIGHLGTRQRRVYGSRGSRTAVGGGKCR